MELSRSLKLRILSGLVLAPLTLAVLYFGGIVFYALLTVAFVISIYELWGLSKASTYKFGLFFLGFVYFGLAYFGFYVVQGLNPSLAILVIVGVWLSDIAAYVVGKFFKGPKLCPKISPNKTWSGLLGAMIVPAVALVCFALKPVACNANDCIYFLNGFYEYAALFGIGCLLGLFGQAGDLIISLLKRHTGLKDTGALIPGHGGLLDRIDSLIFVSFIIGLIIMVGVFL